MKPLRLALVALAALLVAAAVATATQQGTITGITPTTGPTAGGTTVQISGTYLWSAFGPTVTIGGLEATQVSSSGQWGSPQEIAVTTPAHPSGAVDVVVSEYGVEKARVDRGFTYVDPVPAATGPTISAISPASGLTTGGETVTITGSGFSGGTATTVTIGGAAATNLRLVSDTSIIVTTPEHAAGAADVTVTRGTESGTLAGGYTYKQGYWLTVRTTRPASIGDLASPGAVRTPSFGDWSDTAVDKTGTPGLFSQTTTTTTRTGYAGGINCGDRLVARTALFLVPKRTTESWSAGPCRYAFASGTKVALAALASSSSSDLLGIPLDFQSGFLGAWRNDCADVTTGTCTVQMTADRTAGATWGFMRLGFFGLFGEVVYPTYSASGELQYFKTVGLLVRPPTTVGGTPTYLAAFTFRAQGAGASEHGAATGRAQVACRAPARVTGKRITAGCAVTPALARALRRGNVRVTSTLYVRLPHSSKLQTVSRGTATLRGRRTSAVTG